MGITQGMLICGIGAAGILVSIIGLLITIRIFPKQRKKVLDQIESE